MFATRAELIDRAHELVQSSAGSVEAVSESYASKAADRAVLVISRWVPRHVFLQLNGNGTARNYPVTGTLLTQVVPWVPGFSTLTSVQYPADSSEPLPVLLDSVDDYVFYPSIQNPLYIRFLRDIPAAATGNVVINYTAPHTVDDSSDPPSSVVEKHAAFEYYLAAEFCIFYASKYGKDFDNAIEADSTNRLSNAEFWRKLREDFLGLAASVLGIDVDALVGAGGAGAAGGDGTAAGAFHNFDPSSVYGRPILRAGWRR